MAPSYANIFIGRLENLLQSVSLKPHTWLCFIDDIDMKWCHGRDSLQDFLHKANTFHPTIKFTAEISNKEHIFLDTVSHTERQNSSRSTYKLTRSHLYYFRTSVILTTVLTIFHTTAVTLNTVLKIFHTV